MNSSLLLTGIGLRAPHYNSFKETRPPVAWIEVHSENFLHNASDLALLQSLRKDFPISLHGVSTSLAGTDELNWHHLKSIKELIERLDPCLISDHICWNALAGHYYHDLLPIPFTSESLDNLVARISKVQDFLGKQILIENIARYITFNESDFSEESFLCEAATRSGCGILLDVSNIYINATNFNFDPVNYMKALPPHLIQEIHLGGFSSIEMDGKEVLIDSHNNPITLPVWELYREAIFHLGKKPTMIEWDKDLPPLDTLCLEAFRAEKIMRESYVPSKRIA